MAEKQKTALADKKMVVRAIKDSFIKLKPKTQAGNPVMLLVYLSAILTTILFFIVPVFWNWGCTFRIYICNCNHSLVHSIICKFCGSDCRRTRKSTG